MKSNNFDMAPWQHSVFQKMAAAADATFRTEDSLWPCQEEEFEEFVTLHEWFQMTRTVKSCPASECGQTPDLSDVEQSVDTTAEPYSGWPGLVKRGKFGYHRKCRSTRNHRSFVWAVGNVRNRVI